MKYHDYLDEAMAMLFKALAETPIPQSPAPHLEPDEGDEEAYAILWRELKAKDASHD